MAFRVGTSSTSGGIVPFSSIGSKDLVISVGDQICLNSIPGWEPKFREGRGLDDSIEPPLLLTQKTPVTTAAPKPHQVVENGGHTEEVSKRKESANHMVGQASQRNERDISGRAASRDPIPGSPFRNKTAERTLQVYSSKRPRSLPDLGNSLSTVQHRVDTAVPHNGKAAAAEEEHRLRTLIFLPRGTLQKDSAISRSLNNISGMDRVTSSRKRPATGLDVPTAHTPNLGSKDVEQNTGSVKRSCVRRLDLDGGTTSQNFGSAEQTRHQPLVPNKAAGVGSCRQSCSDGISLTLPSKKQQLGSISGTGKNGNEKGATHVKEPGGSSEILNPMSAVFTQTQSLPGNPNHSPEVSQQYRLGPDTQRILMSDFGEDSFCVSRVSRDHPDHRKAPATTVQTQMRVVESDSNDNHLEISTNAGNPQVSDEQFAESQCGEPGDHLEKEEAVRQDTFQGHRTTESECRRVQGLSGVSTLLQRPSACPHVFNFTQPQIEQMCDILWQLYNL